MGKRKKIKALPSVLNRKMKGRTYKSFYKGHSFHGTLYKATKSFVKKGPKRTYRFVVNKLFYDETRLSFPNGLVSGVEKHYIGEWYQKHGKSVSIVIPSYNDFTFLSDCVKSITETVPSNRYKLYVVDDYCDPINQKLLKTLASKNVSVILRKKNGGFAKAVNTGFRKALKANPTWDVVLVNSDIVAHKGWIEGLQYGAYQHDEGVGIVGPKLLYPDGRIQSAGSYRNTEDPEWFDHYYRFQAEDYGPANVPQYCLAVTGACMYITAATIKKIGILDEGYKFAFEDVDYCLQAWQKGIKTLYYPAATLTHVESASRAKNKSISEREKASVTFFWKRWGDWFDNRNVKDASGRVRIIYVLQSTGVSGGIRIVFEHLNRLKELGYAVELWSLDKDPNWMKLDVPRRSFPDYQTLTKALAKEEAIKVATWWETAFPVWLASVNKGVAVYFIQEIESWFYPEQPEAQRTVISCYRKEFINMTTSQYNHEEIRSLGLKAAAIPCGYDDSVFKPLGVARDENTILAVGRSFFQKNFKQTFSAWKLLKKRPLLLLFGAEPEIANGENPVKYVVKPTDEQVNELYNQATVFIQTSYHEGFCLPILEAMATGSPVICTDSHGNRDFCIDKKTCIMVPIDDVTALNKAITKLLSDEKLQRRLSRASLETARRYTWDVIMKEVAKFYDTVAEQPNKKVIKQVIKKYS